MTYQTSTYQTSTFAQDRAQRRMNVARAVAGATKRQDKKSLLARLTRRNEPSMFQKCLAVHLFAAERYRTFS